MVTLDMDFSNPIVFPSNNASGILVLRPPRPSQAVIRTLLEYVLDKIKSGELDGKLWVVEPGRIRVHQPE